MRVLGEIPHPVFKITVFIHNDRFTLQVENGIFSQHYRVRKKPGIECLDDFCQVVDKTFLDGVASIFNTMHVHWRRQVLDRMDPTNVSEFDNIL
jgi:hypothetical protein